MDLKELLLLLSLLPGLSGFSIDTRNSRIITGSVEAQFGYTVQQHETFGEKWLLVGAPFESSGQHQTGDVYRCPVDGGNCTRLNLGRVSLTNVSERKDKMRLGMTLTSNPKDDSFVACGPLWSYECGSSYYSTGICSKFNNNFKFSRTIAPAFQRCETYMDIVIVLDGSNSIYPWYEVQDFLINILQKFYIGPGQIQVGVVQYGEKVVHEFHLNDYRSVEEVVRATRNIEQRGGEETRTALGMSVARSQAFRRGGRRGARKVMIVITDGESHDSADLQEVIEASEKDEITRYAVAVLGYYNRRGIDPQAFLREIRFIASDPDDKHFFNVTDESALKDIVDALGERIFSLEGTNKNETSFGLQMSQAGFSSHIVEDGILVGAVGAYDWTGAVLKETRQGKVIPSKSSYLQEFPEELKNHGAYLGYTVTSVVVSRNGRLYIAGAPRFNHTGKVIIFTLKNNGSFTILHSLKGQQIGSYYGSEIAPLDIDNDGITDYLLVAAPMFLSQGWERGRVSMYHVTDQSDFVLEGVLDVPEQEQNCRFGSALAPIPDLNGDGFVELVVGAPLEDEHRGAVYVFYGQHGRIEGNYKQRIAATHYFPTLRYFGRSVHGRLDMNGDGLVDVCVGSLGAAVLLWSRSVVRVHVNVQFEPHKVNVFNKDCQRGGKDVSCMSAIICLNATARTPISAAQRLSVTYNTLIDEWRFSPRALLDDTDRQQPRNVTLLSGTESCDHVFFYVMETADYVSPVVFTVELGLQEHENGPVLDNNWPTVVRTELPFWNGCEDDERCEPNLVLKSHADLLDHRMFCRITPLSHMGVCEYDWFSAGTERLVEASRRRMVVEARLENQGENAFNVRLNISYTQNLHFSKLTVKDPSDAGITCGDEEEWSHQRFCNITSPFMRAQAQVLFRAEFAFSGSVFLEFVQVLLGVSSDGDDVNMSDNYNTIFHPLRYEANLLFTRDSTPSRLEVTADQSQASLRSTDSTFNFTFQVQNLGFFPVSDLQLRVRIPAVTRGGNQLLQITDIYTDQTHRNLCTLSSPTVQIHVWPENLSLVPQLNISSAGKLLLDCTFSLQAFQSTSVQIIGFLHMEALKTIKFKTLDVVTVAWLELSPTSLMFLHGERPERHIVLEIRKEEESAIPTWIILGSMLGGFLLLALISLALWKMGFFQRHKRQGEQKSSMTTEREH